MMDYVFLAVFVGVGAVFVPAVIWMSSLVGPKRPSAVKQSTYECGETTIGSAWIQFNVGYYLFALLFLVFDVEMIFLFPWATVFRQMGVVALVEGGIFVAILAFGLLYAWKKGALEWV